MQQIVEEAAKSTVNVMEKVNAATEEVGMRLLKKLRVRLLLLRVQ